MRVVVDTNVVVSAFLSPLGPPAEILQRWHDGAFELVVSPVLLAECARALRYPKVLRLHRLSEEELNTAVDAFRQSGILVQPNVALAVVSDDPTDNRVLECAVEGRADVVVSGDRHLLQLQRHGAIAVLAPADFLAMLALSTSSP